MKRRQNTTFSSASPFMIWTSLAWKTAEMMAASAQVIGHRTGRLASAGILPSPRDREEFTLMGQEKIEATVESLQAMALRSMAMQQQIAAVLFRQMVAGTAGILSLAGSRTAAQSTDLQVRLLKDVLTNSSNAANQVGASAAKVMQHGLRPVHSRATANARRLGKLGKS